MAVAMRDRWTDERLDDLKGSVDDGFRRMDEQFARIDERLDQQNVQMANQFGRLDTRIDSLAHAVMYGALTLSAAMIIGFVAMFALIATQL